MSLNPNPIPSHPSLKPTTSIPTTNFPQKAQLPNIALLAPRPWGSRRLDMFHAVVAAAALSKFLVLAQVHNVWELD